MRVFSKKSVWHPYGHLIAPCWKDALTGSEEEALLRAAAATRFPRRNRAILLMLLNTGMRLRACAALAWEDISWVGTQAQVRFRDVPGQPMRTIRLGDDASRALMEYGVPVLRVEASFQRVNAVWPTPRFDGSSTALWENCNGWRLSSQGISRLLADLVEHAEIPIALSHPLAQRLRASFARDYLTTHPGDLDGLLAQLGQKTLGIRSKEAREQHDITMAQMRQVIEGLVKEAASTQRRKAVFMKRVEKHG